MSDKEVERIMKAARYLTLWEAEIHLPISQWSKNTKGKWVKKYHSRKRLLLKIISEHSYATMVEFDAIQALLSQIDSLYLKLKGKVSASHDESTNMECAISKTTKEKDNCKQEKTCAITPISTIDLFGIPVISRSLKIRPIHIAAI